MGVQERKQREFLRREREILDAALELFSGDDWQSVTVEQISEAAEIGKGTVYKHFASKEEIFARLALHFHRGVLEDLQRINPERPVLERLRAILRVLWEHHRKEVKYHRILQHTGGQDFWSKLGGPLEKEWGEMNAAHSAFYVRVLREGVEEGIFPDRPLELLLFGAAAAVGGAVQQVWGGCLEGKDPDQYLEALTDFVLAGLMYQDRDRVRRRVA